MRAETCSCYVLLIKYIVYKKVVIDYKVIYFINDFESVLKGVSFPNLR